MSNEHIRPSSIEGIKQLAKLFKRSNGIQHAVALDEASKAAGFENYKHALRGLGGGLVVPPAESLYISVPWRDRTTKATGCEILKTHLGKPLDALVKPAQYKASRGLAAMRREGPDHLADTYTASSQSAAREAACEAARTIQFIEATGLVPSNAKRSFPRGQFQYRMPGSDHDAAWFDPEAKAFIRTNEPYTRGGVTPEQEEWAARHGWAVAASPWKGMYRPDGGTSLFLLADLSKGYSLESMISRLTKAPAPVLASGWNGESRPIVPAFVSPGRAAEIEAKAREIKTVAKPRSNNNSVEYSLVLSGARRRPKARMPIEAHKSVGRLLKSTLIGTEERAGIHRRVDAIRGELDDWVQCEYNRNELSDAVFFDLYYHELPESDPLAVAPTSRDRHIASLEAVKATLARHYPDCPPLRELQKKADLAIASLRAWNSGSER